MNPVVETLPAFAQPRKSGFSPHVARATKTIRAPLAASSSEAICPIPDVAPVITTTLPLMDWQYIRANAQASYELTLFRHLCRGKVFPQTNPCFRPKSTYRRFDEPN